MVEAAWFVDDAKRPWSAPPPHQPPCPDFAATAPPTARVWRAGSEPFKGVTVADGAHARDAAHPASRLSRQRRKRSSASSAR